MAVGVVGTTWNGRMFAGMRRFEIFFTPRKSLLFFSMCLMRFARRGARRLRPCSDRSSVVHMFFWVKWKGEAESSEYCVGGV